MRCARNTHHFFFTASHVSTGGSSDAFRRSEKKICGWLNTFVMVSGQPGPSQHFSVEMLAALSAASCD